MRQIDAFARRSVVDRGAKDLEAAGVPGGTVSRVHGVRYRYEPEALSLARLDVGSRSPSPRGSLGRRPVAP